ncbi:hypothetical protein DRX01_24625 [Salmonella enterica subsp. enterica serovar Kambole]|nr:hypothetical protein [Salmonella enterica subsp. enterica serovar Everleigh]EBS2658044.1 hypothetical protein [Salmonella enterica subsp. enterica serovar Kambole]EBV2194539.1 hypothetical protein [Salmonella enterica subsp. enterica serovar Afula]ECH9430667.1 hypothetical protein [Salmonella enterica subsp. enterica]EBY4019495.1 hypothetical protein [Salmonella enterica subsp. enterica serovar Kambole]
MILPHLILEAAVVKQRICLLMQKKFIGELYLLILLVTHGLAEIVRGNSIVIKAVMVKSTGTVEKNLIED